MHPNIVIDVKRTRLPIPNNSLLANIENTVQYNNWE